MCTSYARVFAKQKGGYVLMTQPSEGDLLAVEGETVPHDTRCSGGHRGEHRGNVGIQERIGEWETIGARANRDSCASRAKGRTDVLWGTLEGRKRNTISEEIERN